MMIASTLDPNNSDRAITRRRFSSGIQRASRPLNQPNPTIGSTNTNNQCTPSRASPSRIRSASDHPITNDANNAENVMLCPRRPFQNQLTTAMFTARRKRPPRLLASAPRLASRRAARNFSAACRSPKNNSR